jgi:hypothetical protein
MKKCFYFLLTLLLFAGTVHAQTTNDSWWNNWDGQKDIELLNDDGQPVDSLKAWISSDDAIFVGHIDPFYYQRLAILGKRDSTTVVIMGENNDIVYKKDISRPSIDIQLNFLGFPNGHYTLNVFWNKCWWRGEFEFKTHWPEGQYVYIDSTYYRLNKGYANTVKPDYCIQNGRTVTHRMGWMIYERDYPLDVVIPSELTYEGMTYQVNEIGRSSFRYCYYLQSVSLPNTITSIGSLAFAYCDNLRKINIPESVTEIGGGAFGDCFKLSCIVIPEGVTVLNDGVLSGCKELSAVTLPSSLKTIEHNAFGGCTGLPYIEIPDNVTYIGESAFQNCTTLMDMELPKKLKQIDNFAFRGCQRLTSIVFPEAVTNIGVEAFAGCTALASITLPEGMAKIGDEAFKDMPRTGHIYCNAIKPFTIGEKTFNYNCTLHVPQGSKAFYEKASYWKNFKVIEEEPTGEAVHGGETGVTSATLDAESAERLYDLQGRPVDGTQKGILIRNGKKVLVK